MSSFDIVSSGKPSAVQSDTEANSAAGSDNGVNSAAPSENDAIAAPESEDGVVEEVGDDGATLVAEAVDDEVDDDNVDEVGDQLEQVCLILFKKPVIF